MSPSRLALVAALALSSCARASEPPREDAGAPPVASSRPDAFVELARPMAPTDASPSLAAIATIAPSDEVVESAIARGDAPGAVVVVWARDRLLHRKAYGARRVAPDWAPMTVDTVFDLASLTKPIATATAIHQLAAEKRLSLADAARRFLPELGEHQAAITIEQLLLHTSGLPAGAALATFRDGAAMAVRRIGALPLAAPPGSTYTYSDLGYVLLGAIVSRIADEPLDAFATRRIFAPLGLNDTGFRPSPALAARAAPTCRGGQVLAGVVHDPCASQLSGVAGHAGLFSTADDVATFARALLHGGALGDVRVLPEAAVAKMTRAVRVSDTQRTLGWDVYADAGYGHTGFTGTSVTIDPRSSSVVVLLTSRLHPDERGDVRRLRSEVDAAARAAIASKGVLTGVLTGIDVLEREGFGRFAGKKIALVTNRSAVDRAGRRTVDVLRAGGVDVVALLAPEHGLDASVDAFVKDGVDAKTGLPIKSLYDAKRKKPTASELEGADTIVFDLQDAGVRFYTYETTLGLVLESAKELGLHVVVLDRPNPVGSAIEGPLLDEGRTSFTAYHRTPIRHGMTLGELARLFDTERAIGASLEVVPMQGYRRDMSFGDTLLAWVPPSPNLRTEIEAVLYPGVALVEGTNVSVGRGTATPFELVGAPWIDGERLAQHLNARGLEGVSFRPARFTPKSSVHAGVECGGVSITVADAKRVASVRLGVALALSLRALHAEAWDAKNLIRIVGNAATVKALERGDPLDAIVASWKADEAAFAARRQPHLLY